MGRERGAELFVELDRLHDQLEPLVQTVHEVVGGQRGQQYSDVDEQGDSQDSNIL